MPNSCGKYNVFKYRTSAMTLKFKLMNRSSRKREKMLKALGNRRSGKLSLKRKSKRSKSTHSFTVNSLMCVLSFGHSDTSPNAFVFSLGVNPQKLIILKRRVPLERLMCALSFGHSEETPGG